MISFKNAEKKESRKDYGFWVYTELLRKGLSAFEILVISYMINTTKYSPNFELTENSIMNYFNMKTDAFQRVMGNLIEKGFLCYDKEKDCAFLDKENINKIMGFDVFFKK